jgi:hypothetical protein
MYNDIVEQGRTNCNIDLFRFHITLSSYITIHQAMPPNPLVSYQSTDQTPHIIETTRTAMQHSMSRNLISNNRKLGNQRRLRARKLGDVTSDGDVSFINNEEGTQRPGLDVCLIFAVGQGDVD